MLPILVPGERSHSRALSAEAYPPYPAHFPAEVERWLEHLEVRDVSATYHACHAGYVMHPRRIGDDMFFYIVAGRGEVMVEGRTIPVVAGDCGHFLRGQLHAARTDPRHPLDVMALHYSATFFGSLMAQRLINFPDVTRHEPGGLFEAMMLGACRDHATRPVAWKAGLANLAHSLLLDLIRSSPGFTALDPGTVQWRDLNRILPALERMRQDLSRPLSIPELAGHCGLSEAHFRRIFTRGLGVSPLRYLARVRLEAAAILLRGTDLSVEQVAERVGYSDASFFAHSFKGAMGISPGRYRLHPI